MAHDSKIDWETTTIYHTYIVCDTRTHIVPDTIIVCDTCIVRDTWTVQDAQIVRDIKFMIPKIVATPTKRKVPGSKSNGKPP